MWDAMGNVNGGPQLRLTRNTIYVTTDGRLSIEGCRALPGPLPCDTANGVIGGTSTEPC